MTEDSDFTFDKQTGAIVHVPSRQVKMSGTCIVSICIGLMAMRHGWRVLKICVNKGGDSHFHIGR